MSYGEACWRQCCPIGSHLNFFWRVSQKNAKTGIFLHLVNLSEILLLHHISRVPPCESWRPDGYENVGLIGFLSFWTGVIATQSRTRVKFRGPLAKISSVTKKRHGHNFQNWMSVIFFGRLLFSGTKQFFPTLSTSAGYNTVCKAHHPQWGPPYVTHFWNRQDVRFHMVIP